MKRLFSVLFLCIFISSCLSKRDSSYSDEARVDTDSSRVVSVEKLNSPDTVLMLMEEYPVEMDIYDDVLYVVMAKADTFIHLFNKRTGKLLKRIGTVGNGPEDVLSPEFVRNNYENRAIQKGIEMYDMNKKNRFIAYSDSLGSFTKLPEDYLGWGSLNLNQKYLVGKHIGEKNSLFQIYDLRTRRITNVPVYPEPSSALTDKVQDNLWLMYSANVLCNLNLHKIFVSMYYFDMIQVYDLQGKLQNVICLGKDGDNNEKQFRKLLDRKNYVGYIQCYATSDYAYFRRSLKDGETGDAMNNQIAQVDWNGMVTHVWEVGQGMTSGFCIDQDRYLYCIKKGELQNEEAFLILRYALS